MRVFSASSPPAARGVEKRGGHPRTPAKGLAAPWIPALIHELADAKMLSGAMCALVPLYVYRLIRV